MVRHFFILFLILTFDLFGQKPSKKDVKHIFDLTLNSLKTNDSVAFKNLFIPDTNDYCCSGVKEFYDYSMTYPCFKETQQHLKKILEKNSKPDRILIDKMVYVDTTSQPGRPKEITEYYVTAEFKLSRDNFRTITFSCAYYRKRLLFLPSCGNGGTDLTD